ncbi:MAG: 4-alpha-glucanotransferase [Dehalococcoidia bacterium]|nr:4-alpha-glucanotransferase [Dehalococcoidia bacterium]
MNYRRSSGILLHPTSLPSPFGIGDFGPSAYRFIDFLSKAGQRIWQVLPLGPTGYGNSPYQSFSAFAGNPLLISLESLLQEGLLTHADLLNYPILPNLKTDYASVIEHKMPLLRLSYDNFITRAVPELRGELQDFSQQNSEWLDDYALFMAVKNKHNNVAWTEWDQEIASRQPDAVAECTDALKEEVAFEKYLQYQFFTQWGRLKKYCNEKGIKIIGDMPIYIAHDSADVWSHPELFRLDEGGRPTVVAGVPPDYYSEAGQLWGNPLYRWEVMAESGYEWWSRRFMALKDTVDIIRIDHFRGLDEYWEVPAEEVTAINGRWVKGPGAAFFEAIKNNVGVLPIISEDLGVIIPGVSELRDRFDFPGMRVLQFGFGADPMAKEYLPHNYIRNCLVYTGTHDNNTVVGWFGEAKGVESTLTAEQGISERAFALKYLGGDGVDINWKMIHLAMSSVADTAIFPLQDILGLGSEARMNHPGISSGNWEWRYTSDALTDELAARLRELTETYGRALQ